MINTLSRTPAVVHPTQRGGLGQVIEIESAIGKDFELLASFDRVIHPPSPRSAGSD